MAENKQAVEFIDYDADQDLLPQSFRFKWKGQLYLSTEASEDAAVKFRNEGMRHARMENGKVVGVNKIAEVEPLLVSLCTVKIRTDKTGKEGHDRLPDVEVRAWPAKFVKKIFTRIKDMSDLHETETESEIEAQIARLQERLGKIRVGKQATKAPDDEDGSAEKNGQGDGEAISHSQET